MPLVGEAAHSVARIIGDGVGQRRLHAGDSTSPSSREVVDPAGEIANGLADLAFDRRLILVTAHRRENFGQPLRNICEALRTIARRYADTVQIVYPVHPNPNVRGPVYELLGNVPGITLTPPLAYLPMVHLMKMAHIVLTDSGGIQEEAPSLSKPVLVLRDETERPEAVQAGTVKIVGTRVDRIVHGVEQLLEDSALYTKMAQATNPYGDGKAAERIVSAVLGRPVTEFRAAGNTQEWGNTYDA